MMSKTINHIALSHETCDPEAHCLNIPWHGEQYWVCARCIGMGLGFISSFVLLMIPWAVNPMFCVLGMLDWLVCYFTGWRGYNLLRLCAGWFLGHLWCQIVASVILMEYELGTIPAFLCLVAILIFRRWTKLQGKEEEWQT